MNDLSCDDLWVVTGNSMKHDGLLLLVRAATEHDAYRKVAEIVGGTYHHGTATDGDGQDIEIDLIVDEGNDLDCENQAAIQSVAHDGIYGGWEMVAQKAELDMPLDSAVIW